MKFFGILLLSGALGALVGSALWFIHRWVEDYYHPADSLYYFTLFNALFGCVGLVMGIFLGFAMASKDARAFPSISSVLLGAISGLLFAIVPFGGGATGVLVGCILGAAAGCVLYRRALAAQHRR